MFFSFTTEVNNFYLLENLGQGDKRYYANTQNNPILKQPQKTFLEKSNIHPAYLPRCSELELTRYIRFLRVCTGCN
jgi:hypothetical protein